MFTEYPVESQKYADNGFSFSDTLGGFIGNREFSEGFYDFQNGHETAKSFTWDVFQAIGGEIGKTVYQNIRNYVALASDVETCRVAALQSMLDEVGFNFTLVDANSIPCELLEMIDIYSVDRKYLVNSGFVSDELRSRISSAAMTQGDARLSDLGFDSLSGVSLEGGLFDDGKYRDFLVDEFRTVISSFITLPYNVSLSVNPYVYMSLASWLQEDDDEIRKFMAKNNISPDFQYEHILDDIENGVDSYDNYQIQEVSVLNMAAAKRAAPMNSEQTRKTFGATLSAYQLKSRYSYYRKRKVQEYIGFVNNSYHTQAGEGGTTVSQYHIDPDYVLVEGDGSSPQVVNPDSTSGAPSSDVDFEMVDSVARQLARTTVYIQELRERIKLQSRKNYMKGTNNLVLYLINEYLIDYSRNALASQNVSGDIAKVYSRLSSHDIHDVNVVEYYDNTEYYDIETETSISAAKADSPVNGRYWLKDGAMDQDGMQFKLDQIDGFYLSTMHVEDAPDRKLTHDELTDFLDTIYDFAARRDFIDPNGDFQTGWFDGKYSNQIEPTFAEMKKCRDTVLKYLDDGYEPEKKVLPEQCRDIRTYILSSLQDTYLSAVSAVYDENIDSPRRLADEVGELDGDYTAFVTGEYSLYFNKQDTEVEYDYINGNPKYATDLITERLYNIDQFVGAAGSIVNHYALDTAKEVDAKQVELSTRVMRDIAPSFYDLGYNRTLSIDSLQERLDSLKEFADSKVQERKDFINQMMSNIRSQVEQVNNDFNSMNNAFTMAVANYDTGSPQYVLGSTEYYRFSKNQANAGQGYLKFKYKEQLTSTVSPDKEYIIMPGTGWVFFEKKSGEYYGWKETVPANAVYNNEDSLKERCAEIKGWMALETFDGQYGLKNDGILACADSTIKGLNDITNKLVSVVEQIRDMFGYDMAKASGFDTPKAFINNTTVENALLMMTRFVTTDLDDTYIEKDAKLNQYIGYSNQVQSAQAEFQPYLDAFARIFTNSDQQSYMADFQQQNDVTRVTTTLIYGLLQYIGKTDSANFVGVRAGVDALMAKLSNIQSEYARVRASLEGKVQVPETDIYYLEDSIAALEESLVDSVDRSRQEGWTQINSIMDGEVNPSLDFLYENVRDSAASTEPFMEVVQRRIDELDYTATDTYATNKRIMLTYGGQSFAYYPYLSWKNVVHPSYQIHPFLWNFVEKNSFNVSDLSKLFFSANVVNFEMNQAARKMDGYYGRFGELIDKWRHSELIDYTGYTSLYESSNHVYGGTHLTSEVVDYDGAFYPPAIDYLFGGELDGIDDELCAHIERCADSVLSAYTRGSTYDLVMRYASRSIYDFIEFDEVVTEGVVDMGFVDCDPLIQAISDVAAVADVDFAEVSAEVSAWASKTPYGQHEWTALAEVVRDGVPETFYERFYVHLGISPVNRLARRQFIHDQILEYSPSIQDIVRPSDASAVYDIAFYGKDLRDDAFVLYKKYGEVDLGYKDKKNTPGELWIRDSANPLAFPAFSGSNPQAFTANEYLSALTPPFMYDLFMSDDGSQCAFVTRAAGVDDSAQMYENPWILMVPLQNPPDDRGQLQLIYDKSVNYDRRLTTNPDDPAGETTLTSMDIPEGDYVQAYAYLGSTQHKTDDIDHVFALKTYSSSGAMLGDSIQVVRTKDCVVVDPVLRASYPFSDDAASDQICFSKHQDDDIVHFDFAYLVEEDMSRTQAQRYGNHVDLSSNTDGPVYDDPRTDEMNSHDVFTSDVKVVGFDASDSAIQSRSAGKYNINADESYIPSYPAEDGRLGLSSIDDHAQVEFLGMAHQLTQLSAGVNTNIDPYFDHEKLSARIYGRVYEDYFSRADNSFFEFSNPSLNNHIQPDADDTSMYIWTMDLPSTLTDVQKTQMKVLFQSLATMGKNPYLVSDLSAIQEAGIVQVNYQDELPSGDSRITTPDGDFVFSGRTNPLNTSDTVHSNRLSGVSDISVQYDGSTLSVIFQLYTESESYDHVFVPKGELKVTMFNPYDVTQFERYHFFDTNGFVKVLTTAGYNVTSGDHFSIQVGQQADDNPRFFIDEHGQRKLLSEVLLSDYTALSDVYCFSGSDKLKFMYSEKDYFLDIQDRGYYYPTLNWKYPRTEAQLVADGVGLLEGFNRAAEDSRFGAETSAMTFILNMEDPATLADSIGDVAVILESNSSDDLVVDDGWEPGLYDVDDPRVLEYGIFSEYDPDMEDQITTLIDSSTTTEAALDAVAEQASAFVLRSDDGTSVGTNEHVVVHIDSESGIDFQRFLNIYANYEKTGDGIRLLFNYHNFLETPFSELRDGMEYPVILDNSYLVLDPGKSGTLDVVVQVRYELNGLLYGIRTVVLASYFIVNVSDDKPKLVIRRLGRIRRNQYASVEYDCFASVAADEIQMDEGAAATTYVGVRTNTELEPGYFVTIRYDRRFGANVPSSAGLGFEVVEQNAQTGYLKAKVTSSGDVSMPVMLDATGVPAGKYPVEVEVDGIRGKDFDVQVSVRNGYVRVS